MYKTQSQVVARGLAREHHQWYGMSVLDGAWYVGAPEELAAIGCVEPSACNADDAWKDGISVGQSRMRLRAVQVALRLVATHDGETARAIARAINSLSLDMEGGE